MASKLCLLSSSWCCNERCRVFSAHTYYYPMLNCNSVNSANDELFQRGLRFRVEAANSNANAISYSSDSHSFDPDLHSVLELATESELCEIDQFFLAPAT